MHVHVSALDAVIVFMYVIIIGAMWRLVAAHLAANDNDTVATIGKTMGVLY